MKHVTIKDIASRLHLSVSTVSRALSDDKSIKEETKQRIIRAADEMGYKRNPAATLLRTGKTHVVGVVVNEMLTSSASKVLEGIQRVLPDLGYRVQFANSHESTDTERTNLKMMESSMVDGLIVIPCNSTGSVENIRQHAQNIPIVLFGREMQVPNVTKVVTNDYQNAYHLTRHMLEGGNRRIVLVSHASTVHPHDEIRRGYEDCHHDMHIPIDNDLIINIEVSNQAGRDIAEKLVSEGIDFDGVIACSDIIAIGIMNRLHAFGKRIPEDVSVAGFSGSQLAQIVYPTLTTVEYPLAEIGERLAQILMSQIQGDATPGETITVDSKVCFRQSTLPSEN
ncbi:MAG: LacI family transcriptional regulator [Muribaculum sp.]|nr:LacI family transcriptional regulator [Muribaculum sp.]